MRNVAMVGAGMTPFGEHFELGIKDLLPMAYAEAVAHVDKGIERSDIQAAWFGELTTVDGFPAGDGDLGEVERVGEDARGKTPAPQAMTRFVTEPSRWRRGCTTSCSWSVRTRFAKPRPTSRSGSGHR